MLLRMKSLPWPIELMNSRRLVCLVFALTITAANAEGLPQISSFTPHFGYKEGGTRLQIQGENFSDSMSVLIDNIPCADLLLYSPKELECTAPPHEEGIAPLTIKTRSGAFTTSRHTFAYIQELVPSPGYFRLLVGTKQNVTVRGGQPPYSFRIAKGDGTIDSAGVFTASLTPGAGLIEIQDSKNNLGFVPWEIFSPVAIVPETQTMKTDHVLKIGVMGGVPPYRLSKISGEGEVLGNGFFFRSPFNPGKATLKAVDSLGNSAEATIHFEKGPELRKRKIAVGNEHSCALIGGKILCWGSNADGQVGTLLVKRNTTAPVKTTGLDDEAVSVVSGLQHTCALLRSGSLKCWGDNRFGQIGDGTLQSRREPVQVIGMDSGVTGVVAGEFYTCAVAYDRLYCWGKNDKGQLGLRNRTNARVPEVVPDIGKYITAVGAGASHTCVIENFANVKCWGDNNNGQLGRGDRESSLTPIGITDISGKLEEIAAGWAHTCALVSGGVKCWGFNGIGTLGQGSKKDRFAPVEVSGMSRGVHFLTGGQYHNCATLDGRVSCWGYNYQGQVGDATLRNRTMPVPVKGLGAYAQDVATGSNHSCAILEEQEVACWGENYLGQLGDGTNEQKSAPGRALLKKAK